MINDPSQVEPAPDTALVRPRRSWKQRLRRITIVSTVLLIVASIVFYRPLFLGNFGVVAPGLVYRTAQPHGNLDSLIERHKIATVLNLRGGSPKDGWYVSEVEATAKHKTAFYDLSMSATKRPARRDLLAVIDVVQKCDYPLLIHCRKGADRTGMACGIYRMLREGWSPEQALSEFTIFHIHVPLFGPEKLHAPFNEYAAWLKTEGVEHTPDRFVKWAREVYQANDRAENYRPVTPGPRHQLKGADSQTGGS